MEEYLSGSKASKALGVHQRTLHNWDEKKLIETIRTPGGKRLYNVRKYLQNREKNEEVKKKIINENINEIINENFFPPTGGEKKIIYARVSSVGQKQDLKRQILSLQTNYPNYELIKDIGSGVNLNRKGLRKIIDYAIRGEIEEVIVMHKDRLCRFGYELIEDLIKKYSNGKIIIVTKKEVKEPD